MLDSATFDTASPITADPPTTSQETADSSGPDTRPLTQQLTEIADTWRRSLYLLVTLAAEFADSHEWVIAGARTPAQWLATLVDAETCTAREWIRVGKSLRDLPLIDQAFASGDVSYSKVRALTRIATPENQIQILEIARKHPASELGAALAVWFKDNTTEEEFEQHQRSRRSVRWRTEPDGMVLFTLRLQPHIAATLIAFLTTIVMRAKPKPQDDERWPSLAMQHADAMEELLTAGPGDVATEVVLHVRGDGCTLDDGTPIADSVVERVAPDAFLRVLIHDAEAEPVNASHRQRHPSTRQKRVVKERDRVCVDCGRAQLLEYDHTPNYAISGRTITDELELRCGPCHHLRHRN